MFGIENSANNFGRSAGLLANTIANRPTTAALGTIFYGTDNLFIYRYDGTSWITYTTGAGISGATNGLQVIGANVGMGGTLTQNTDISGINSFSFKFQNYSSFAIGNSTEPSMIFDTAFQTIESFNNGLSVGLKLDFANNQYFLGNQELIINAASGQLDFSFGGTGLQMTTFGRICYLGDTTGGANGTTFLVDDVSNLINTFNQGFSIGLSFDFTNFEYKFGDFSNSYSGTSLFINDLLQLIRTRHTGSNRGLKLDFANLVYSLGDYDLATNGYYIDIDDTLGELRFNGANLQSGSASGSSGQHLVIWLNGTQYKIKLENP